MVSPILDQALIALRAEISVIPLRSDGTKRPSGPWKRYQSERMDELDAHLAFQAADGFGAVCGQVSGRLLALDFEGRFVEDGGMTRLLAAVDSAGLNELWGRVSSGATVGTPSGGMHVLVRLLDDAEPVGNEKLAFDPTGLVTIETRGEGGFVVGAGSGGHTHRNGGSWEWFEGGWSTIEYISASEWHAIRMLLVGFDDRPAGPVSVPPLRLAADSPGWISEAKRSAPDLITVLERHGWTFVADERKGQLWRHPRATNDHSARITPAGRLYVWSGLPVVSEGTNQTFDACEVDLMEQLGRYPTDAEMGRWFAHYAPSRPSGTQLGGAEPDDVAVPPAAVDSVVLPESFWQELPWLGDVYEYALAIDLSPDALLGAVLARYASLLPVGLKVRGSKGASALNLFNVIVGDSGTGKSTAMWVAEAMLPNPATGAFRTENLRSGEGLVTAATASRNKDTGEITTVQGLLLNIDEGSQLAKMTARSGETMLSYLCTAWSGHGILGGAKAGGNEALRAERVRFAAVIGLQPSNTAATMALFGGEALAQGFASRLDLFDTWHPAVAVRDNEVPDPPLLDVAKYAAGIYSAGRHEFTLEASVVAEMRRSFVDRANRSLTSDPHSSHTMLKRARMAAVLGLSVGEMHDDGRFWGMAALVEDCSSRARHALLAQIASQRTAQNRQRGVDDADREESRLETLTGREALRDADRRVKLLEKIRKARSITQTELLENAKGATRPQLRAILAELIEEGAVIHSDGRLSLRRE